MKQSFQLVALFYLAIIFGGSACVPVWAQATGSLSGTVTDPTGASIPNASVTVSQSLGGFIKKLNSGPDGTFTVNGIPPGDYQLEIMANGFSSQTLKNVAIVPGQSVSRDVQLGLAVASTDIVVTDTSNPVGSYKVPSVDFGPIGTVSVLDTPYSVVAVPTNLMENEGVRKFSDVLKYLPGAQMEPRSGMDVGRPQTRGFEGTVNQNARIDGMNIGSTTQYPMEQFDRIEVQNGLVGSEYGAATPAGNFNFILKRPTQDLTAKVSLDLDTPSTGTMNGDLGGMISKYFGFRMDALHTNGAGYIDRSRRQREMLASSVDIHPWRRAVLQLNGSQFAAHDYGFPGNFAYGGANTVLPSAPKLTLRGLGQAWAGIDMWTRTISARYLHTLNDNWSLTLGALHQSENRLMLTLTNTITDNAGDFNQTMSNGQNGVFFVNSTVGYLKGHFRTYGLTHDIALGTNGNVMQTVSSGSTPVVTVYKGGTKVSGAVASNLYNPVITAATISGSFGSFTKGSTATSENFVASDTIQFARRWILQFVGGEVWIRNYSFSKGAISSTYDVNAFAPSASILYKPAQNMSAYFTYASSLYNGDSYTNTTSTAGGVTTVTNYTNPGYLPPYRSKQYEAGYKWDFRGAEVTLAAYRMTRPLPHLLLNSKVVSGSTTTYTYTAEIEGTQQNDGLDLMVTGKVRKDLNVFGGLTWLNPELTGTSYAATDGKQVTGVPRIQSSFLLEYDVPHINGLAINGNWHHTGVKAGDDQNVIWAPKFDTFDLGARYDQRRNFGDVSWRLSVANVGNANYWYGIFPGGSGLSGQAVATVAGQVVSGNSAFLGAPRVLSASVQYRFSRREK